MRKILIVGASQAGLHLAHGLLDHGYDVTVATARTSTEVRTSVPPLVGFTLPSVVIAESQRGRHGLDFWGETAPRIDAVAMSFRPEPAQQIDFTGHFTNPATMIDRRVKAADWLEYFEDRGGKVVIHGMTNTDLDHFTQMFDLVVVAVGGGVLGELFAPDPNRLSNARPRRITQLLLDSSPDDEVTVLTAPWGEIFETPILTAEGPARALMVACAPGGPLDYWPDDGSVVEGVRHRVRDHAPDVAERLRGVELLPGRSVTERRITPVVRDPVGVLPSGGLVLGIGNVLCEPDPITGQETPDETRAAETYLQAICEHGDHPFDEKTLRSIFDRYFRDHGAVSADFTHLVGSWWDQEPAPHVLALLGAAHTHPAVADRWVAGFDTPRIYTDLLGDPDRAYAFLAEVGALPPAPESGSLPPT